MRRGALGLVALLLIAIAGAPAAGARPRGSFTRHEYGVAGEPGARLYWKFVPAGLGTARVPLLVYLHGCSQTAENAAAQTRFNELAARERFIVVYPQQNVTPNTSYPLADGNGSGCWNWFVPDHQARAAGEPATIAAITRRVMRAHRVDRRRVFVEGVSAGADMAVIMAATYPDLYASAVVLAGCPYRTCADASGELTYQAMGSRARMVPILVANSTTDNLNAFPLAASLVQSWLGVADRADGAPDGSVSRAPASIEHRAIDQSPAPGSGDVCARPQNWGCPGGAIGWRSEYPHSILRYLDARGCGIVDFWIIHGMTHAYPNADTSVGWGDPLGPNMTRAAWDFFESHPRGGCAR